MLDNFSLRFVSFLPSREILPRSKGEVRRSFSAGAISVHEVKSLAFIILAGIGEGFIKRRVTGTDLAMGQERDLTSRLEKVSVPDDARQGVRAYRPSWSPSGRPARCRNHRGLGRSHGTRSHEDAPS